jgi:hypothetical protein
VFDSNGNDGSFRSSSGTTAVIVLRTAHTDGNNNSSSLVKMTQSGSARGVPEAAACYATPPEGTSEGELAETVGRALRGAPNSSMTVDSR